jgi:hypothetical protein
LISGFRGARITEITIPDSVEEIDRSGFCASRLKRINFGEHSKLKKIQGFHFCDIKEIELPESIEVIDDEAFVHCHQLKVLRIRGNPNIRRFSGMRPHCHDVCQRGRTGRMIEFGPDAAISRLPMRRFSKAIELCLANHKDMQYKCFCNESPPHRQQPTFIRYPELSLKRFRSEFEGTLTNPKKGREIWKDPCYSDNEMDNPYYSDNEMDNEEDQDDSDDDDW